MPPSAAGSSPGHPRFGRCIHCRARRIIRARGLCNTCYFDAAIRPRYPILPSRTGRCGPQAVRRVISETPFVRTDDRPGTKEKLRVMCERAALGHPIFHPLDRLAVLRPVERAGVRSENRET